MIEERTLVDGGQTAESIAARLVAWLGEARTSLDEGLRRTIEWYRAANP